MKSKKRETMCITIPKDLLDRLDVQCDRLMLTRSAFVSMGLSEYLALLKFQQDPDRLIDELHMLRDELEELKSEHD